MTLDTMATEGLAVMWVVLIGVVALLLGAGLGYFLRSKKSADKTRISELEDLLAGKDEELTGYRAEVVNQFAQTAEKFKTLDESYHALHRQLATSAASLCGDQAMPLLTKAEADDVLASPDNENQAPEAEVHEISESEAGDAAAFEDLDDGDNPALSSATEQEAEAETDAETEEKAETRAASGLGTVERAAQAAEAARADAESASQASHLEDDIVVTEELLDVPVLTEDVSDDHETSSRERNQA